MNKPATAIQLPAIGEAFEGGFFAGIFRDAAGAGPNRALIKAPKALGERADVWNKSWDRVDDALSFCDGMANTMAMAKAGSRLAQWALDQRINGVDGWHIPAQDQLELLYRAFKPTNDDNTLYGRSGLNVSAVPPTYPYTKNLPHMVNKTEFRPGGAEAFEDDWYWSSTQHAGSDDCAWMQRFGYGSQIYVHKGFQSRVVLVRSIPL